MAIGYNKAEDKNKNRLNVSAQVTPFADGTYVTLVYREEGNTSPAVQSVANGDNTNAYVYEAAADFSSKVLEAYKPSSGTLANTDGYITQLRGADEKTAELFIGAMEKAADAMGAKFSVAHVKGFPVPTQDNVSLTITATVTPFPDGNYVTLSYRKTGDTTAIIQHIPDPGDVRVSSAAADFSSKVLKVYKPTSGTLAANMNGCITQLRGADKETTENFLGALKQAAAQMNHSISVDRVAGFPVPNSLPRPRMS